MPTYEYECGQCGHTFELLQSMKDDPIRDCPSCQGQGTVKRLIGSGAGLIFKGSGFYITDYKNVPGGDKGSASSGKPADAKASGSGGEAKSSSDGTAAKSESKAESKPAASAPSGGAAGGSSSGPSSGSAS